jgi:hypothetical protein
MPEELVVDDEFEEPLETTTDEVKPEEYELGNTDFDFVLDVIDEKLDVQTVTQRAAERSARSRKEQHAKIISSHSFVYTSR